MPLIDIDKQLSDIIPMILKKGSSDKSVVQGKQDYHKLFREYLNDFQTCT